MVEILVDDDPIIRLAWSKAAQKKGVCLRTYVGIDELLKDLEQFPRKVPIYLDSDLGDGRLGEVEAVELYGKGYTHLYIQTGFDPKQISAPSCIRAVLDKTPPW